MEMLIKTKNVKEHFADNSFHNILRRCDILLKFLFTVNY